MSKFHVTRVGDDTPGASAGRQGLRRLTREGITRGVTFNFLWLDQNGDRQPETSGVDLPNKVVLEPKPPQKVIKPTWQVGKHKDSREPTILALANGADGAVAKNVVIESDPNPFTFVLKRDLGDLEGIGILHFGGSLTGHGRHLGVELYVTHEDVNGEEHTDLVPASFNTG